MFRVRYYNDEENRIIWFKGTNTVYNKLMRFILKSIMLCLRYVGENKIIQ